MGPAGFPSGSVVKNPPALQEMHVQSLDMEDPPEEEMAPHSSIAAWKNSMDKGAWRATVHRVKKELDTTECLSRAHSAYTISSVWFWKGPEAVLLIKYIKNSSVKQTHFSWVGHSKTRSSSMSIRNCLPIFLRLLVAFRVENEGLWRSYRCHSIFNIKLIVIC